MSPVSNHEDADDEAPSSSHTVTDQAYRVVGCSGEPA